MNQEQIERIKSILLRSPDSALIDEVVAKYGNSLRSCTGIISLETCEWIAVFIAPVESGGARVVLKVGVKPPCS